MCCVSGFTTSARELVRGVAVSVLDTSGQKEHALMSVVSDRAHDGTWRKPNSQTDVYRDAATTYKHEWW